MPLTMVSKIMCNSAVIDNLIAFLKIVTHSIDSDLEFFTAINSRLTSPTDSSQKGRTIPNVSSKQELSGAHRFIKRCEQKLQVMRDILGQLIAALDREPITPKK